MITLICLFSYHYKDVTCLPGLYSEETSFYLSTNAVDLHKQRLGYLHDASGYTGQNIRNN